MIIFFACLILFTVFRFLYNQEIEKEVNYWNYLHKKCNDNKKEYLEIKNKKQ